MLGNSVMLSLNNGAETLNVPTNGGFQFTGEVGDGEAYSVTVQGLPTAPVESCSISNGSGTATADVNYIVVTCSDIIFKHGLED